MRHIGRSRRARRRVGFELLERRDLLAFDVSLVDDVVTFQGDADADSLTLGVDESGYLRHNLALTPELVSAVDLDGTTAGEQRRRLDSIGLLDVQGDESTDDVVIDDSAFHIGEGGLRVRASEIVVDGQIGADESGAVSLIAGRNIRLTETASIITARGDISLRANMGEEHREGDFHGVSLIGATISSVRGDIRLQGRGGNGLDNQDGVHVAGDSRIESREAGRISIYGDAGAGDGGNDGVQIFGAATKISAVDGTVDIVGRGSLDSSGVSNRGVTLRTGATVISTGTGANAATIRIQGFGGAGESFNHGVHIRDALTEITSVAGAIEIIGEGNRRDQAEQSNTGVVVAAGGSIRSTGVGPNAGTIRVRGTGGAGTSFNDAVLVTNSGTKITSVDGDIDIVGFGSSNVTEVNNTGVEIRSGAIVESTGLGASAATISITGTGGNGTRYNDGVFVDELGTRISSVDGDILLTGIAKGSGGWNTGTRIDDGASIGSTGVGPAAGRITISGTGSGGDGNNRGVWLADAATAIRTVDGDLLIQGTGDDRIFSQGILIGRGTIEATGVGPHAASIVMDGTGGNGGVYISIARVITRDGDVNLFGTGGAYDAASSRGVVLAREALVRSRGIGDITLIGSGSDGTGKNHGVVVGSGSVIESTDVTPDAGSIFLQGTAGPESSSQGVRVADAGTSILSHGGDITLVGKVDEGHDYGLQIEFDATVASTGSGNINLASEGADSAAILFDAISLGTATSTGTIGIESTRLKLTCDVVLHGVDEVNFRAGTSSPPVIAFTLNGLTPVEDHGQLIIPGDSRELQLIGATLEVELGDEFAPQAGDAVVLVNVLEASSRVLPLDGLPEGAIVVASGEEFVLSYQGGDGNDVSLTALTTAMRQNQTLPEDVNADGEASPVDALVVINAINRGLQAGESEQRSSMFYDTNGDGALSPADALLVINYLNRVAIGEGSSSTDTAFRASNSPTADVATVEAVEWPSADAFGDLEEDTSELESRLIERVFREFSDAPDLLADINL